MNFNWPMKMDFSLFSQDEPIVWLDWVTQFFKYQQMAEGQKVMLATFYLECEAN
jgi:hypothetical protein